MRLAPVKLTTLPSAREQLVLFGAKQGTVQEVARFISDDDSSRMVRVTDASHVFRGSFGTTASGHHFTEDGSRASGQQDTTLWSRRLHCPIRSNVADSDDPSPSSTCLVLRHMLNIA